MREYNSLPHIRNFSGLDGTLGIPTHYRLDSLGFEPQWGQHFLHTSRPAHCAMGTRSLSLAKISQGDVSPTPSTNKVKVGVQLYFYEGRLISNAQSEISRKRDHIFKQTKVGSKVQYFSYKLTYLFFDIVALSFIHFSQRKTSFACRQ